MELTFDGEQLTLKDIIEEKVKTEVHLFNEKQRETYGLEYTSVEDLIRRSGDGTINVDPRKVDEKAEIEKALKGFEDGAYKIFLNGEHLTDLDAAIHYSMEDKITFIRLILLAGG